MADRAAENFKKTFGTGGGLTVRLEGCVLIGDHFPQHSAINVRLGGEMAEQQRLGNAGSSGDLLGARAFQSVPGKNGLRRGDYGGAAAGAGKASG
jgi:hypothetical protein